MRLGRVLMALVGIGAAAEGAAGEPTIENPRIDMAAYLAMVQEAAAHRERHRLTEEAFLRAMREPGVVILDARSQALYDKLHVRGAINLSFPDIAEATLAARLPDKRTKILIYCNNNFTNEQEAFPSKLPAASLNVPTYVALYTYGYRNVWELGPLLDARTSRIPLVRSPR